MNKNLQLMKLHDFYIYIYILTVVRVILQRVKADVAVVFLCAVVPEAYSG